MPAKSKAQQRYMGMVHKCQKTGECSSEEVEKTAKSMKKKDAEDFASTKHKGLPEKKRKRKGSGKFVKESLDEFLSEDYSSDSPDLPEFEDSVIDMLQEFGLTWEEADFAIGQTDPEQMDSWREWVLIGDMTIRDVAEQIYRSSFR